MPDIYPSGKLELYTNIKLDPSYKDTLSWDTETARDTFFNNTNLKKHSLSARQYQRVTSGVCEVQLPINQVYDCNYMRFQNSDFSTLWYYCFITNVEYVNNVSTRIYYELDVLTTYYHWWEFLPSFVEREHSTTDTPGDNLVEEPVKFDDPIPFDYVRHKFSSFYLCIAQSYIGTIEGVRRAAIAQAGRMYTGCLIAAFPVTRIDDFQEALSAFEEGTGDILNIFIYPSELASITDASVFNGLKQTITFNDVRETLTKPTSIGGYTPRNKKLLTFPYCYLCLDNGTITNNYQFEFFPANTFQFIYRGVPMPSPNLYAAPLNYKGVTPSGQQIQPCYEERLELNDLPQIAFPTDSYRAWLAQTQSSRQTKIITGAAAGVASGIGLGAKGGAAIGAAGGPIGAGAGAAIGAVLGGVIGAIGAKAMNDRSVTEAADMKNKSNGTGSGGVNIADNELGYIYKYMGVKRNDAQTIDSFFDMFGYATNRIKYPNYKNRPHWNYLKTNGLNMNLLAGIPADYILKIKAIHDQGVTYWKNHAEIGDYSLNNAPV